MESLWTLMSASVVRVEKRWKRYALDRRGMKLSRSKK